MKKALALAGKGKGHTSPNPMVGSVIVKHGQIIGEGYHKKYGGKHAEIMAIDTASSSVEGATLYCNLEPCTMNIPDKKTPPCTERIIKEKIRRVVIANLDPNPYVNGKGVERLRNSHIQVDTSILQEECSRLNETYFTFHRVGRPFVHLKIAQSLDGRIATAKGKSKWITNENALKVVHQMRAEYDAILVGINTILQDNPSLNVRKVTGKNPYRIILDDNLSIPLNVNLFNLEDPQKTIIFTNKSDQDKKFKTLKKMGIQVISISSNGMRYLDLNLIMASLTKMKIFSVLVEGGGEVFTSFIKNRIFDKISFFIAPMMIGSGIQSIGNLGIDSLDEALRLHHVKIEIIDQQAVIEGYRDFQQILV
jgi:diaminohydroxyphosphoribosylaminopyrimidine deaminase/5-amino-6-(5-phosphoribosylamino)uracil reductase